MREESVVIQDSTDRSEAKVFQAHAPPQGACENLVYALKLLAKQQLGSDSPVQVLVEGLEEESSFNIKDELGRFIKVNVGYLGKYSVALHVVEFKSSKDDVPEATVRERVEELALRKVDFELSSIPRMWETMGVDHR